MDSITYIFTGALACSLDGCIASSILLLITAGVKRQMVGVLVGSGHLVVGSLGLVVAHMVSFHPGLPYLVAAVSYCTFALWHFHSHDSPHNLSWASLLWLSFTLSLDSFPWGAFAYRYRSDNLWFLAQGGGQVEASLLRSLEIIGITAIAVGMITSTVVYSGAFALRLTAVFHQHWLRHVGAYARPLAMTAMLFFAARAFWAALGTVAFNVAVYYPRLDFLLATEKAPVAALQVAGGVAILFGCIWWHRPRNSIIQIRSCHASPRSTCGCHKH